MFNKKIKRPQQNSRTWIQEWEPELAFIEHKSTTCKVLCPMRYRSLECYCKLCDYFFLKEIIEKLGQEYIFFLDALHSRDGSLENVSHSLLLCACHGSSWNSIHGFVIGPCPHRDRDYCIGSNFGKFYIVRTVFTLGEPVSLVKVFRLEWIFLGVFRVWTQ
jgi:hypothetical protein